MPFSDHITGLILAGGDSIRFGSDKAAFPIDDVPMIEHVFRALTPVTKEVLIGISAGQPALYDLCGRYIVDYYSDIGPMAGIHAGLTEMKTSWLLVVACDMPFIQTESLLRLVFQCRPAKQAVVGTGPDGYKQPCCSCYNGSLLPLVERRIQTGHYSILDMMKEALPQTNVRLPGRDVSNINRLLDSDRQ